MDRGSHRRINRNGENRVANYLIGSDLLDKGVGKVL